MTSLSLTEDDVLKVVKDEALSFEKIVLGIKKSRERVGVRPGSRSTVSRALKSLYGKGLVDYDVESRRWKVTSVGLWVAQGYTRTEATEALTKVTGRFLSGIEDKPERLLNLLPAMFAYSVAEGDRKMPISEKQLFEKQLFEQTKARLVPFVKGNLTPIAAIWIDDAEVLIGKYSSLLAAILLLCLSLWGRVDRRQVELTIQKVVAQWFRLLGEEIGKHLSTCLADAKDLAVLEKKLKEEEHRLRRPNRQ
jgi:DNA-binding transcriptional ArsR family regulator